MIRKLLLAALCGLALSPLAANAQWLDSLKNAAARAAVNAAEKALESPKAQPAALAPSTPSASASADAAAPAPALAQAAPASGCRKLKGKVQPPVGPRPADFKPEILWPEETSCSYYKFADLKFDAARAQKKQFEDASKVRCGDCEGGYFPEAWAHFMMGKGGISKEKFEEMLVALKPGQTIAWKGKQFAGEVGLTGEQPVGGTACKQFHWLLKDKAGKLVAEREGMYCQYTGDYSSVAKWHEIL